MNKWAACGLFAAMAMAGVARAEEPPVPTDPAILASWTDQQEKHYAARRESLGDAMDDLQSRILAELQEGPALRALKAESQRLYKEQEMIQVRLNDIHDQQMKHAAEQLAKAFPGTVDLYLQPPSAEGQGPANRPTLAKVKFTQALYVAGRTMLQFRGEGTTLWTVDPAKIVMVMASGK